MIDVLNWIGDHPILSVILAIIVCGNAATVARVIARALIR